MVTTEQNNTPIEEVMKLNLESQKAMTLAILQEIKNSEYDDTDVKKTLADYNIELNKVKEMAKVLDDLEKGQIEEMLLKLLNNANLYRYLGYNTFVSIFLFFELASTDANLLVPPSNAPVTALARARLYRVSDFTAL